MDETFFEVFFLEKNKDDLFVLYRKKGSSKEEIKKMNLVLKGNILNISEIKIKSYFIE
jgi:hypothetical protein